MNVTYRAPAAAQRVLFALFALSGFCGLIYESIWAYYLKLFVGHAAYARRPARHRGSEREPDRDRS